jgi:hypothetical protein
VPLFRGQHQHVYGRCMRCGCRWPLDQMVWQKGKLLCTGYQCNDTAIIGSRDLNVARQVAIDRHEGQPDPKLTHPTDPRHDYGIE